MAAYNKSFVSSLYSKGSLPILVEPSQWELFLRKLKLSDSEVLETLCFRSRTSTKIKGWVRTHYRKVFVPEAILETMGIKTEFDL